MSGVVISPAVTQADLAALIAAMPQASNAAPQAVTSDSSAGTSSLLSRGDHAHESRLQARRIQVTPNTSGQYVYVFPKAYPTGIIPIVNVTAETPTGSTYKIDAGILQGSTTEAQTTIVVTKLNQSVVTGLLNAVLPVFAPQTSAVWVNIMSRAPS